MRVTNSLLNKQTVTKKKFVESNLDHPETRWSETSFGDFAGIDRFRKTKSILYIMLAFLAIAYSGVTFIFSILAYRATADRTWEISQLVTNWKNTPIVAISAFNEKVCPIGFEPLGETIWPGTFEGCFCPQEVSEPKLRGSLVVGS